MANWKTATVITPVWNRCDLTYNFLSQHWMRYQHNPRFNWVIVDNGSTDETQGVLVVSESLMGDRLTTIRNLKNIGFGAANNQAVAKHDGDLLVFVNNDVIIKGDYLGMIWKTLKENPEALAGAECLTHDTGWNRFGDRPPIAYIPGWCLAMSRATFNDLGGFDERYGLADYEDMDMCYAAQKAGRQLIGIPGLPIQHISNQTAKQLPDRLALTKTNQISFAEKWGFVDVINGATAE